MDKWYVTLQLTIGMRNVKRPSQRKILPVRNAYKKEPEQTKNNIHKQEKKLIRSLREKEAMVK